VDSFRLLSATNNWRLQRLRRCVETDFLAALSFTRAAEICRLEKTYFCRFFRAQTGMAFSEWARQIRIQRAKDLLTNGHRSIPQVAAAAGYQDISTFERHFRKCESVSPIQFRKRERLSRLEAGPQQMLKNTQ
jgi:two-component system, response regulator YesN